MKLFPKILIVATSALLAAGFAGLPAWADSHVVNCTGGGTFTITSNVVTESSGCVSAVIPNSVTSIGDSAFLLSTSLTSVTFEADSLLTSIGDFAFAYATSLTSVTIPNSVISIGDYAFQSATSLTSITIPNSVTSIGDHAFEKATSLTSITIPNSVTSIGNSAFENATSLASVTFEAGSVLTTIGDFAFTFATALTSITIPNSVTSIGESVFDGATALTSITIPNSVTSIGDFAFIDAVSLTSITIPNSVTAIANFAFYRTTSLTSITFEAGSVLTSIGEGAFGIATSLASITIPNSVTTIGDNAFRDATALTSVTFEGNAPSTVGTNAFRNFATDAVANIGFAATGFGEESTWNGLILVRASGAPAPAAPTPYTGPLLQDFSSRTLDVCTPKSITITGIRLLGATASVQGKSVTVLENTDTKLVLAFPAGLTPGNNVDLVINSSSGTLTHQDAFDIPADTCAAVLSKGRWTQLQSDGTTVKIYAKDPIGDGKIQFFVDGEEIAWVNAIDEADPKLSFASSYPYLVRSVELKPGKNRFEIKLDGVRVWRATYVPKG